MIEVRCPQCGKLLFKADGFGSRIEAYCPRCKVQISWPSPRPEVVPADKPAGTQRAAR